MKIYTILKMTREVYEELLIEKYVRWCMSLCVVNITTELQQIIANKAVNAYYILEYDKLEQEFLNTLKGYEGIELSAKEARELYTEITGKTFMLNPKPLIESAKKTNIYHELTAN